MEKFEQGERCTMVRENAMNFARKGRKQQGCHWYDCKVRGQLICFVGYDIGGPETRGLLGTP